MGLIRPLVEQRQAEFATVAEKVRADPINEGVRERIRSPWPSQNILRAVFNMTWRIGYPTEREKFLTSDNPAHYLGCLGIGRSDSEFTFPLSPSAAIYASWVGRPATVEHFDAPARLVRECNRRTAHGAVRFVFFPTAEDWIAILATKENPLFSRIDWQQTRG